MTDYFSEEEEGPGDRRNSREARLVRENELLRAELLQLKSAKEGMQYGRGPGHPGSFRDLGTAIQKNPDSLEERVDVHLKSAGTCPVTLHSGASLVQLRSSGEDLDYPGGDFGASPVTREGTALIHRPDPDVELANPVPAASVDEFNGAYALLSLQGHRPPEVVLEESKGGTQH